MFCITMSDQHLSRQDKMTRSELSADLDWIDGREVLRQGDIQEVQRGAEEEGPGSWWTGYPRRSSIQPWKINRYLFCLSVFCNLTSISWFIGRVGHVKSNKNVQQSFMSPFIPWISTFMRDFTPIRSGWVSRGKIYFPAVWWLFLDFLKY